MITKRQWRITSFALVAFILLSLAALYFAMQDRLYLYSGPAEVVLREHEDEYRLKVCMLENGRCRLSEVPRAIYEVAHEGTIVELDKGEVLYTDNMRP